MADAEIFSFNLRLRVFDGSLAQRPFPATFPPEQAVNAVKLKVDKLKWNQSGHKKLCSSRWGTRISFWIGISLGSFLFCLVLRGWRGWRTNQCDICYLLQVKRSKTSGRNLQFLYKCLPLKRAAVKIQMICLTSFFLSCEYTSDIFPRLFRPPPAVCQKLRQKNGEENIEEVHQNHNTWELMSSERESRAKQDRDHPAVMVTEPDQHQGTIRENDAGSSLKSLIFPSQGGSLHKMKSYFDATLIPPPYNELKGPSTAARRFQYWEI